MNKDYRTAKFVNLNNKWVSYTSQEELLKLYEDEIDRLNNIIKELEKWAKSIQLTVYRSDGMPVYQRQDVLDKLKELQNK